MQPEKEDPPPPGWCMAAVKNPNVHPPPPTPRNKAFVKGFLIIGFP